MSDRVNQHFVPQFYFKNFNGGDPRIHLLHKPTDKIIFNAPIKGQCAKHRLYGDAEVFLSQLEVRYSRAIQNAIHTAWNPWDARLDIECLHNLMQGVLVQRLRTMYEVGRFASASESMHLEMFKDHLRYAPDIARREEMIAAIEKGQFRVKENPTRIASELLLMAVDSVLLITDLGIRLLRNYSGLPFLFGDSPVVFCNSYYRNVTSRGVLGLQTPGLQIIFPLDPHTLLMLMDDTVYSGNYKAHTTVDVTERCDVSRLNALQLHQSLNAVYFANPDDASYIENLWRAHKSNAVHPRTIFQVRSDVLVDDKPVEKAFHWFDPHLNCDLDLSFVRCDPIDEAEYVFSRRTPAIAAEVKQITAKRNEEIRRMRKLRRQAKGMIRACNDADFDAIFAIINDAAQAYCGVIPADRWHDPYMPKEHLRHEIDSGVQFWGWEEGGELVGVMGIQDVQDVTLIRHAYVRTANRGQGIGGKLLGELRKLTTRPVLIGTWAAATWAIRFYEKHGFRLVTPEEKDRLLKKYWSIPERQIETSVVLAEEKWFGQRQ